MTTDTLYPWDVADAGTGPCIRLTEADLDHHADRLAEELFTLAAETETTHLVLDFAAVGQVTPATADQIALLRRWLRQLSGSLTLANVPASYHTLLRVTA